jgi:hypothetical protein
MILTERDTDEGRLVTVCDSAIIGETFEDGEISLTVTEEFYGGREVDENTVVESLSRATVANIVGTEAVEVAIEHGFVEEANVIDVDGTRHAQLLQIT